MPFLEILWTRFVAFLFVSYLMLLFSIFGDLLRDGDTGGGTKAAWVLGLVLVPFLTALGYLVVRGDAMASRAGARHEQVRQAQDDHIRDVAATSPAQQIRVAEQLVGSGAITTDEFDQLKARALA